jgi:hypothetical protein
MTAYFSVRDFDRLQHYRNRTPPWVKLYNDLLDNYEFARLQDASKAHLVLLYLLASRHANRLPCDSDWLARRMGATEPVNLQVLADAGFIIMEQSASGVLADCKQDACLEGETERETDKREEKRTVPAGTLRANGNGAHAPQTTDGHDGTQQGSPAGGDDGDKRRRHPSVGSLDAPNATLSQGVAVEREGCALPGSPRVSVLPGRRDGGHGSGLSPVRDSLALSPDDAETLESLTRDFKRLKQEVGTKPREPESVRVAAPAPPPVDVFPEQMTPEWVVELWAKRAGVRLDPTIIESQMPAARWLAKQDPESVGRAFYGIGYVWPHSKGEAWTCQSVKAKWSEAIANSERHPDLVNARTARRITERMEGAR